MGNPGHNCLVDCIELALQSESASASSSEDTRVELLEYGELNVAVDGLGGLTALVSTSAVQVIDCTVQVPGWDTTSKGRHVSGEEPFRENKWCRSWSTDAVWGLTGKGGG